MRIPEDKIEEVRAANDIVDVVGAFVKLKKRGKSYIGLCPFHTEKTPSFTLSPDRQMYHCFGCGAGGNVFTFVMQLEKLTFVEAVRSLAEKGGVALPSADPREAEQAGANEELYRACQIASEFYRESLRETAEGKGALTYYRERRFTEETISSFGLGYAPNSWDALISHAAGKGCPPEVLERAGLARKKDEGGMYDAFRGRAMFPITSPSGRVIGFGARKLRDDDPLGKYINSPETPVYQKSRVLYGLYQAKDAIRTADSAVLVEGYADCISVAQGGVRNVVASSGTALTAEQVRLLKRYTGNVTIVYDADAAGSKAAVRGIEVVLEQDMDVRVVSLPEGEDPDSFVRKRGGEAFRALVDGAQSFVDFIALTCEKEGKLSIPAGTAEAIRLLVHTLARIGDDIRRAVYVKHVVARFGLYESDVRRELEMQLGRRKPAPAVPGESAVSSGHRPEKPDEPAEIPPAERDIVRAMLMGGSQVVRFVFERMVLDHFQHPRTRSLASFLLHRLEEGESLDPSSFVHGIGDPGQRGLVEEIMVSRHHLSREGSEKFSEADSLTIAADALNALRRASLVRMKKENERLIQEAARRGEDYMPLLERSVQIDREMKELETKR